MHASQAEAFPKEGRLKNSLGIGIVGAGAIAGRILEHLSLPDVYDTVHLAAVCDPVPGRAKTAAAKYSIQRSYESYEELLADPNVDMLTICSPIGLHFKQGMMAIQSGKHAHFNKTMAVTLQEADLLIGAAKEKGVKLVSSPGVMLWPFNQRKRKYILERRLGRMVWASGNSGNAGDYHINEPERQNDRDVLRSVNPSWYFQKNGGGPLYDSTVYAMHSMTGVLGPARSVTAVTSKVRETFEYHGKIIPNEMDDLIMLLVGFDDGVYGLITSIPTAEPPAFGGQFCVFYGLDAYINENGLNGKGELTYEGDMMPHHFGKHGPMWEAHVYEDIMQLADWVTGDGAAPLCSTAHARHVIEMIDACYASARSGSRITLATSFTPMTLEEINASLERFGGKGGSKESPRLWIPRQ